ncbi:MAG: hypothetical protein WA009_13865 [Phototrophicaceae bacterium]
MRFTPDVRRSGASTRGECRLHHIIAQQWFYPGPATLGYPED